MRANARTRRRPAQPGMEEPVTGITSSAASQVQTQRLEGRQLANSAITIFLGAWLLSVSLGVALHTDVQAANKEIKARLPLAWFDEVLRRYGALLPFFPFAIRWYAAALAQPGPGVRPPAHFAEAVCLYVGLSLARLLLYGLHVVGVLHWLCRGLLAGDPWHGDQHLVSDHLVLGASVTAILMAEAALGCADLRRALLSSQRPERFRLLCLSTGLLLSVLLCAALVADMFFTALLFHGRAESAGGLLVGALLFQGPVAYWLLTSGTRS